MIFNGFVLSLNKKMYKIKKKNIKKSLNRTFKFDNQNTSK